MTNKASFASWQGISNDNDTRRSNQRFQSCSLSLPPLPADMRSRRRTFGSGLQMVHSKQPLQSHQSLEEPPPLPESQLERPCLRSFQKNSIPDQPPVCCSQVNDRSLLFARGKEASIASLNLTTDLYSGLPCGLNSSQSPGQSFSLPAFLTQASQTLTAHGRPLIIKVPMLASKANSGAC